MNPPLGSAETLVAERLVPRRPLLVLLVVLEDPAPCFEHVVHRVHRVRQSETVTWLKMADS